jgi:hypothetical protein
LQAAAEVALEEKAAPQQQPQVEAAAQAGLILRGAFRHPFLGLRKLSQLAQAVLEGLL